MAFRSFNSKSLSEFVHSLTFFLLIQLIVSLILLVLIYLLYPDGVDSISDEIGIIGSIGAISLIIRGAYSIFAGWKWRSKNKRKILLRDWFEPLTIFGGVLFSCIFVIWFLIPSIDEFLFWPTSGVLLVGIDAFLVSLLLISFAEPMGEGVFIFAILFLLFSMTTIPVIHFLFFFIGYIVKDKFFHKDELIDTSVPYSRVKITEKDIRYITILIGYFGVLFAFLFRNSEKATVLGIDLEMQPPLIMIFMDVTGLIGLIILYMILSYIIKKK